MDIKKLNEKLANVLENANEQEKSDDFYWNMVKDFDEYVSKNILITEAVINEVLTTDCGLELQPASIKLIPNFETYNLAPVSTSFTLGEKIDWLIDYMNIVKKQDLIGLKVVDAGRIVYKLYGKPFEKRFIIHTGNCKTCSEQLTSNSEQPCGLHHMKYGKHKHWKRSCEALRLIPSVFNKPIKIYQSKKPNQQFNYIFYTPNGYTYAFGVPINNQHQAILISCY